MVIMEYKAVMYFFSGYAVCVTDADALMMKISSRAY
jgi:hypothetical protein